MKVLDTKKIALSAVGVALMFVVTSFLRFAMPSGGGGYVHLGDTVLFVFSFVGGPIVGGLTGGVGGFFADLYGYPSYAVYTLIIKGVQGAIVGGLGKAVFKNQKFGIFYFIGVMLVAGAWMIVGYFFVETIVYGWAYAIANILGNIIQILVGVIFATLAYPSVGRLYKAELLQKHNDELEQKLQEKDA